MIEATGMLDRLHADLLERAGEDGHIRRAIPLDELAARHGLDRSALKVALLQLDSGRQRVRRLRFGNYGGVFCLLSVRVLREHERSDWGSRGHATQFPAGDSGDITTEE